MNQLANIAFDPDQTAELVFSEKSGVNTTEDVLIAQVSENIRRGLPQVRPDYPNQETICLVAGGPSLEKTKHELIDLYWRGAKIVAVNGTYNWCIEKNIKPSAMVLMDARPFNARFVEQAVPKCKYFISSQCHPDAFELCRDRETFIWHAISAGERELELLDEFYFGRKNHHPITLGTTVSLRAISLLRLIGFLRFEIFGLDSCWMEGEHHAYEQPENGNEQPLPIWPKPRDHKIAPRRFLCSPWHAKQAMDFMELIKERGDLFQLNVHGDGLIAYIMRTSAELQLTEGA